MNALVTGARGTVGSVLCRRIAESGGTAYGWDRGEAPCGDFDAARRLMDRLLPTVVFHAALPSQPTGLENEGWLVNEKWTSDLAALALERGIAMVFVSTVMVYKNTAQGPFGPDTVPDETEGYGFFKRQGELAARAANPRAHVVRLGWQIGHEPAGNNMVFHLDKQFRENGEITASTGFLPATSFLEDTADGLIAAAQQEPGDYLINSNPGYNFHQIACALNELRGHPWKIRATEDFTQDQRMIDPRVPIKRLEERLPALGARD